MFVSQSIQRPQGINAFGSCLVRVDPDYASLRFGVTRVERKPAEAFAVARESVRRVRSFLASEAVPDRDVRASDVALEEAWEGYNQDRRMVGYRASVPFHVIVRDHARVEPLLVGIVEAGADRIYSVHAKSTRLKEVRREARQQAVRSARAKAEEYAIAAGVRLGVLLHLEDVNADELGRGRSHIPDVDLSSHDEAGDRAEAQNPGGIVIAAAVMACFAIHLT